MAYKLYTDKPELFECDVAVKNASLKNSMARLIIESDTIDLIFKGSIKDGKCTIPVKKLKGLLNESDTGKMHLEIIVEDTYFSPWSDSFVVEEHTSLKVQVKEQKETSKKPILEVKVKESIKTIKPKLSVASKELLGLCELFNITSKNYKTKKRSDFKDLIREYFKQNGEFQKKMTPILNEVVSNLL